MEFKFKLLIFHVLFVLTIATQMMDGAFGNPFSGDRTQVDFGVHNRQAVKEDPTVTMEKQSNKIIELKKKLKGLKKDEKQAKKDIQNLKDELDKCRGIEGK